MALASDGPLIDPLDCCHMSLVKYDPLISNGHLNVKVHRQHVSDALDATHQTRDPHTGRYSKSLETAQGDVRHVQWCSSVALTPPGQCTPLSTSFPRAYACLLSPAHSLVVAVAQCSHHE